MEYEIITADNAEDLSFRVSGKLADGWKLHYGPLCVRLYPPHSPAGRDCFMQAVVKSL